MEAWRPQPNPWYVAERSEALAGALLTSRKDIRVRSERNCASGPDFLVEIDPDAPLSTRLFVVQVKGTTSSNPDDWTQDVEPLFRGSGGQIYLPACVFVVNVRENNASYAWVAEPQIEAKGATLRFHRTAAFHALSPTAVADIVDQVKAWYDVLPKQLMPARGVRRRSKVCTTRDEGRRPVAIKSLDPRSSRPEVIIPGAPGVRDHGAIGGRLRA